MRSVASCRVGFGTGPLECASIQFPEGVVSTIKYRRVSATKVQVPIEAPTSRRIFCKNDKLAESPMNINFPFPSRINLDRWGTGAVDDWRTVCCGELLDVLSRGLFSRFIKRSMVISASLVSAISSLRWKEPCEALCCVGSTGATEKRHSASTPLVTHRPQGCNPSHRSFRRLQFSQALTHRRRASSWTFLRGILLGQGMV